MEPVLKLALADQAGLELAEICLPLLGLKACATTARREGVALSIVVPISAHIRRISREHIFKILGTTGVSKPGFRNLQRVPVLSSQDEKIPQCSQWLVWAGREQWRLLGRREKIKEEKGS